MTVAPNEPTADPEALSAGTQVGEHVIDDVLGSGGFARVYRARHPVLGTEVAIKVITRALALDPDATQRFIREAQAASRIVHPNVVRVVGFGRLDDGRAYQTMELVRGRSLAEYLTTHAPLPLHEALGILAAVARALEAAHAAGIVHRDVKPANVLLEGTGAAVHARLSDFGIAKALELDDAPNLTTTGVTLGTPSYMAPEQALGRTIGPATDVYSFGVLAFELLTGRVPFEGESAFATMVMQVQTSPPAASSVCPEIGDRFDAALKAMLAKHPEDRPATIAAALASLQVGTPQGPAVSSVRVRKTRWAVTASVTAIALVGLGVGIWSWSSRAAEASEAASSTDAFVPVIGPIQEPVGVEPVPQRVPDAVPTVKSRAVEPTSKPQPRKRVPADAAQAEPPAIDPADDIEPPGRYKL